MRAQDLALSRDLRHYGAQGLMIGQELSKDAGDVDLNLPRISVAWQFLLEIIPIQIAAERLVHEGGQDCDSFRICAYIVEEVGGLIPENKGSVRKDRREDIAR